jgi:uncharacterized protein YecE (DUF72 family)
MTNLRIGTSGWSYPSGKGSWNGLFYPARQKSRSKSRGTGSFDELAYYAERFDTVEINTTFYGQPKAPVARSWAERTPGDFAFSLKLHRDLTHTAAATGLQLDPVAVDLYRRGIEPLAASGKIGALLAQFPASFKQMPQSLAYLDALLRGFRGYPMAVELRHKSWSDGFGETLAVLNAHGAALVQIDEPKFRLSIRQNQLPNITGFYYMRLHGRNAAKWWRHDTSEDRYNYLYSANELTAFKETAEAARRLVRKAYMYFNNHFAAKSVVNAVMIKSQLGEPVAGSYPSEFVARYPETASIVSLEPAPQFVLK